MRKSLLKFAIAFGVLGLEVPQVAAHNGEILVRLETQLFLCERGIRSEVGNVATTARNTLFSEIRKKGRELFTAVR
jgi:hypothetical protein